MPPGKVLFQPYISVTKFNGIYNDHWKSEHRPTLWQVNQFNAIIIGLTDFMDMQLFPDWFYNFSQGASSAVFGDFTVTLDFQLLRDAADARFPSILLQIGETFPTGKYQKLNPNKYGTDIGGAGTYGTSAGVTFSKIFHFNSRFLSTRVNSTVFVNAPVDVKGLNFYGGGKGTDGTVRPGCISTTFLSFEYTLTQNWNLASDFVFNHVFKDHFSGFTGCNSDGTKATVGRPESSQVSMAPAIEYAFSPNIGLLGGVWLTLGGQNAPRFTSGSISFVGVF